MGVCLQDPAGDGAALSVYRCPIQLPSFSSSGKSSVLSPAPPEQPHSQPKAKEGGGNPGIWESPPPWKAEPTELPHLAVAASRRSRDPHLVLQRERQQHGAGPAELHLAPLSQLQLQVHRGLRLHCTQIHQQFSPSFTQDCWVLLSHYSPPELNSVLLNSVFKSCSIAWQ